jgi:hypothetical protein
VKREKRMRDEHAEKLIETNREKKRERKDRDKIEMKGAMEIEMLRKKQRQIKEIHYTVKLR